MSKKPLGVSKSVFYRRIKKIAERPLELIEGTSNAEVTGNDSTVKTGMGSTDNGDNIVSPENDTVSGANHPLDLLQPNNYVMSILRLAEKHHLTNICVSDLLKVINEALVTNASDQFITSYCELEKTLNMEKISVLCHHICKKCGSITSASLYNKPFENLQCCQQKPSQNDDHFIVFNIKHLLQMKLPMLEPAEIREQDLANSEAASILRAKADLKDSDFTLTLNTDGASPFKCSKISLWPILAFINEQAAVNRKNNVIMLGLWVGKCKPVFTTFLDKIIDQLLELETNGVVWTKHDTTVICSKISLLCVMCDSIARPLVQFTFQFNGSYGCTYCYYYGTTHYYPSHDGTLPELRNEESHINDVRNIGSSLSSRGVKAATPFMRLKNFDPIDGFPPDIMHCVYLGVVKNMTNTWIDNPSKFFCIPKAIEFIDDYIATIRPPKRVSRLPRPLKYHKIWKAHEWSMWLYYYSPIILQNVLKEPYFQHWIQLVKGMCIITSTENATVEIFNLCENYMKTFVSRLEDMYSINTCTFNSHLLLHLPYYFKKYGPLHYLSMSTFENYNHTMNTFITNSQFLSTQIAKRYLRSSILKFHDSDKERGEASWSKELKVNGLTFIDRVPKFDYSNTLLELLLQKFIDTGRTQIFRRVYTKTRKMLYSQMYIKRRDCNTALLVDGTAFECKAFVLDTKTNCGYGFGTKISLYPFHAQLGHIFTKSDGIEQLEPIENFKDIMLTIEYDKQLYISRFVNSMENNDE